LACLPQAWSAAAPFYLLQSCIGLAFETESRRIVFEKPALPRFLDEVVLRGVNVGFHKTDIALRRSNDGGVIVDVLKKDASIEVLVRT
jgi:glycogen debranching enzyme